MYEEIDKNGQNNFIQRLNDVYSTATLPSTGEYEQPVLTKCTAGDNKFQYSHCAAYKSPFRRDQAHGAHVADGNSP